MTKHSCNCFSSLKWWLNKSELNTSASIRYNSYLIDADVFNSDLIATCKIQQISTLLGQKLWLQRKREHTLHSTYNGLIIIMQTKISKSKRVWSN